MNSYNSYYTIEWDTLPLTSTLSSMSIYRSNHFLCFCTLHAQTVADVTQEQLEADDDVSLQQRVFMATATTAEGASEIVDNEIAAGRYSMLDMLYM